MFLTHINVESGNRPPSLESSVDQQPGWFWNLDYLNLEHINPLSVTKFFLSYLPRVRVSWTMAGCLQDLLVCDNQPTSPFFSPGSSTLLQATASFGGVVLVFEELGLPRGKPVM